MDLLVITGGTGALDRDRTHSWASRSFFLRYLYSAGHHGARCAHLYDSVLRGVTAQLDQASVPAVAGAD